MNIIEAFLRKREGLRALMPEKQPLQKQAPQTANPKPAATATTPEKSYFKELKSIEVLKQKFIQPPQPKGSTMSKLSGFFIVLLLLISGSLLFLGGYILNTMHTARPLNSGLVAQMSEDSDTAWRKPQVIGEPPAQEQPAHSTYAERKEFLEDSDQESESALQQGSHSAFMAFRREVSRLFYHGLMNANSWVRDVFGTSAARIFNPFARTVVRQELHDAGHVLDDRLEERHENKSDDHGSTSVGAPAAQASGAADTSASPTSAAEGASQASAHRGASETASAGNASTAPHQENESASGPSGPALYAIELSRFSDSSQAYSYAKKLRDNGYRATYVVRSHQNNDVVFTVRIGNFRTFNDAVEVRKILDVPSHIVIALSDENYVKF